MAHAQKPDFVFRRNGRVHLNRRGTLVQSTTGSRGVRISGSNAGYTMFRANVKGTGYPLHSRVSSSLPLPCVTVCHHISNAVYLGTSLMHLGISETPTYIGTFKWRWLRMRLESSQRNMKKGFTTTSTSKGSDCSTTVN